MTNISNSFLKAWQVLFAISIIAIGVITVALFDKNELPLTIVGALLGVAMTVFATFFLFKGQSEQQAALQEQQQRLQLALLEQQQRQQLTLLNEQKEMERKQERDVEIFKQKLRNYQMFLDALCSYVETKTDSSKSKLTFQTAALSMHGNSKRQKKINEAIGGILSLYNGKEKDDKKLLTNLFEISSYFREDLYPDGESIKSDVDDEFMKSIESLADAIQNSDTETDPDVEKADENLDAIEIDNATKAGVEQWDSFVKSNQDWNFLIKKGDILIRSKRSQAAIDFKMKGGYYVVEASIGDNKGIPIMLKDQFNGKRSGSLWWKPLGTLRNYRVKAGALPEDIETNDGARAVVIRWFNRISDALTAV